MGRNLILVLREELENLDKDPDSRRAAMKALESYVKDLDSRTIPLFLAQICETKEPGSSFGECRVSLFEVLARVHGRGMVPHIDSIMSMIIQTLLSSAGSFALQQACSKVVSAIARYGIDHSMPDDEKRRIVSSLCKPLSDCLMGPQESVASGVALCLKAFVGSDNWQFASDELVNEVCLKVAGALEEKQTQTSSHLSLAVALLKDNALIVEAYARSLVRSGLQILCAGVKDSDSRVRLSAIQMINILMKYVDSRSIFSEIPNIVDVMGKCQRDHMLNVRGAAFEALQTAKTIAAKKGSRYEVSPNPIIGLDFDRRNNGGKLWAAKDHIVKRGAGSPEVPTPESQTAVSFVDYDAFVDSLFPVEQSSCDFVCARHDKRRSWSGDFGVVGRTLKDGCLCKAGSSRGSSVIHFEQSKNGGLSETHKEHSETLSEVARPSITYLETRAITPSPQISRRYLTADDIKVCLTPHKILRSHQNSVNPRLEDLEQECSKMAMSTALCEVQWNHARTVSAKDLSQNLNREVKGRRNHESRRELDNQQHILGAVLVTETTDSVLSVGDHHADSACRDFSRSDCEGRNDSRMPRKRSICGRAALHFICCLCIIFLAVVLSEWWIDDDELSYVVPA
ncbi:protein SINE1-like isoform X2 [Phoenix dactylifera]|uniref:Protein SINE1-like isoform X2 n=1 Tax=Phoenix dactylifera TaxID=42345 RepID=A0A8B9AQX2_PHODC|nr:protein SINE1-like isoform X2 [Phoenix dactylifera]